MLLKQVAVCTSGQVVFEIMRNYSITLGKQKKENVPVCVCICAHTDMLGEKRGLFIPFYTAALLRCNSHPTWFTHPYKVYNSVVFSIFTALCNQHHSQYIFVLPKEPL